MQPVIITTKVVSSNPVHGEVYSIQHYVIKFVSDLRQVSVFFPGAPVFFNNKTDRHDITEILLKVVLSTINQTRMYLIVTHVIYLFKKSLKLRKGNKKLSIDRQCNA